jgi:hypothetical protein
MTNFDPPRGRIGPSHNSQLPQVFSVPDIASSH